MWTAIGLSCLPLAAAESKQIAQVSNTQRFDFPAGGTLDFKNSHGVLTVEAWDRPEVEMTTIKSTKVELDASGREKAIRGFDRVRVTVARQGGDMVITTDFPRWMVNSQLEYHVKAPATCRIIDHHRAGDVNIDGMTGDIDVKVHQGEILLHLPESGRYNIHANSDFGSVNSDFPELEKGKWWLPGHQSVAENPAAPHALHLKVGFGDIVILKTRVPQAPGSPIPGRKSETL